MLRKSNASPSGTWMRFHDLPRSADCRITPFDPDAQMTGTSLLPEPDLYPMLIPRKFASIPLVCTVHHEPSLPAACAKIATARTMRSGVRNFIRRRHTSRILAALSPEGRDFSRAAGKSRFVEPQPLNP